MLRKTNDLLCSAKVSTMNTDLHMYNTSSRQQILAKPITNHYNVTIQQSMGESKFAK